MKRTVYGGQIGDLPREQYDVVVVGSGIAGLYCALNLDPKLKVAVLNKSGNTISNSYYAQGGIAAVVEPEDNFESHFADTLEAGAYLCDEEAVRVLVHDGPAQIAHLVSMGVPFDTDGTGHLHATREGAHSFNRIVHCGGDATGLGVTRRLMEIALTRTNLTVREHVFLMDILTDGSGRACGVLTEEGGQARRYEARSIVIASGGIGRVYRNSTNARCATGDGIAAAHRAGARLQDMEFVQFHPTALIHPDSQGRFFLISEALRGEGAVLRNRRWERFMQDVHPRAELAPRDVVTRAIIREMQRFDLPHVYLDITSKPRSFLSARFPTIYEECMSRGIDIARDWIPVIPVQHYFMGGIATDTEARTTVPGLYACGEAARTGVHGANRLASNSLLECLVFGRRCAEDINGGSSPAPASSDWQPDGATAEYGEDLDAIRTEIRKLMTRKGGIIRNATGMTEGLTRVDEILAGMEGAALAGAKARETYNMASVAHAVLTAALARPGSVGAHFRDDQPQEDDSDD